MVRTDDNSLIVIQFTYTSDNGNGIYGFEYQKDNYGNYGLVRHGEDVTIDNLVNAEWSGLICGYCSGKEIREWNVHFVM